MKNILNKWMSVVLFFATVVSCSGPEGNLPGGILNGVNSRVVFNDYPDNAYLKVTDLANASMKFDLYSANTDIDHIDFTATYKNQVGYVSPSKPVFTVNGSDFVKGKVTALTKTATELAALFGVEGGIAGLAPGESFTFTQKAYLKDGRTFDATNSAPSIAASATGSFTAPFTVFIACPSFVVADAVGDWTITRDDFGFIQDDQVTIKAGPGANQVTLVDLASGTGAYNVILDIAVPGKGDITLAKQKAWDCADLGCPYGVGSMQGTGIFFSCAGFILIDAAHTVAAGGFGTFRLELHKN